MSTERSHRCPACKEPMVRASKGGYCAKCQRARRAAAKERRAGTADATHTPTRRRQRLTFEPGLKAGQVWFQNYAEPDRLPIQHITRDIERTASVLRTFYSREEFDMLMQLCREEGGSR